MIKKLRRSFITLWIFIIIGLGVWIFFHRELLEPKRLLSFFQSFGPFALIVYILFSLIRGLILLPSLPLVLVGILFFPNNTHIVFLISMFGIIFSGILIYRFSHIMGFDEIFAEHSHNKKIEAAIEKYGFFIVLLWSFMPIIPTDLICYAAGTVKMNFWKFIIALTIGEGCIVGVIIYSGTGIISLFGI